MHLARHGAGKLRNRVSLGFAELRLRFRIVFDRRTQFVDAVGQTARRSLDRSADVLLRKLLEAREIGAN